MTTRYDILKALGYTGNQIEVMTNPLSPMTWTAERRLIRLADVLADDGLIYDTAHSPSFGSTKPDAAMLSMRVYRAAILAALKGKT